MAVNYRSKQQTVATGGSDIVLLTPGAGIDTVIVNSLVCKQQSGSVSTGVEMKIAKDDGTGLTKSFFQADFGDTVNAGADYPANKAAEVLTSPIVLESGDELIVEIEGGSFTFFLQYAERTTAAATGDIENLSNVSNDAPSNNDVLIYNSASGQYEPGSVSSAGTGTITGTNALTEEIPNRFMKRLDLLDDLSSAGNADYLAANPGVLFLTQQAGNNPVRTITFEDIMAAIVQSGVDTLVDAGYGTTATYTADGSSTTGDLDGDGAVTTADLLQFLVQFGQVLDVVTNTFSQSLVVFRTSPGAGGGGTQLLAQGTVYPMPLSTADNSYIVDSTGSQDVTVNSTAGTVVFEENQVDFAAQGGFKVVLVNDGGADAAIEVLSKEDGTNVQIILRIRALDSTGLELGIFEEVLHDGVYDASSVYVDAGLPPVRTYSGVSFDLLDDPDPRQYEVSFRARRLSTNAQNPSVRFNDMVIRFAKA